LRSNHKDTKNLCVFVVKLATADMRLDQFLKLSRLVVRRSVAAEMCRAGAVRINDMAAKAGREIKENDIITLRRRGELLKARILSVPTGNVPKSQAPSLYDVLSVEPYKEIDNLLNLDEEVDEDGEN
jgi:ribosomal 50S subunit-recycling heat shock protein